MKNKLLFWILLGFPSLVLARGLFTGLTEDSRLCATAAIHGDYEQMLRFTSPRIVERMGGKPATVSRLKLTWEEMSKKGIQFESATIGIFGKMKNVNGWLIVLVPEHVVMKIPTGHAEFDSSLLAISMDEGDSWTFIDLGRLPREQFEVIYPELIGQFDYPVSTQPVFRTD